uniref:AAA+ ATPase domain-containing protein n=1 Tax=Leersia perrieri TaxID=77586 RepID=A0A0D9XQI6_9ORYZ
METAILSRVDFESTHMEAVILAVTKIGSVLVEEATIAAITNLSEKVTNLKELPTKVEEIKEELKAMNNVIKKMSTSHPTDEVVKDWIAEVRGLAHRVQDVMDKYSYYALKLEEENVVKKLFTKTNYAIVFSGIAEEINQIEKKIENVGKRKKRWLQQPDLISNPVAYIERKQSQDCLLAQDYLVGIEDNRKLLTEWLYSSETGNTVITVSGMGGLGKTALVNNVYEQAKNNFNACYWIVVSQTYNVVDLLRKLLRKIEYPEQTQLSDLDARDMKNIIKEKLKDKKILIVLDDVWRKEAYTLIEDAFQNCQTSRIIITTRQGDVAALAQPTRQLKVKKLEHNDAFKLFCKKAFHNSKYIKCPQDLEKLAHDIVDGCQGVPLAIVTIGGLLSSMEPENYVWNEMYKQLGDELVNNNHVQAILNLSYRDLPGHLRNCFLYCSLFPEDHLLPRETLVWLWVAEGFAVRKQHSTPEEVADRYLRELIQRNMLEVVEIDELGRASNCKMHDLVRDLALSIAKEEKFGYANDYGTIIKMDTDVRRLSSCGWEDSTVLRLNFPRLRTLVSIRAMSSCSYMLSSILSESKYLTVLELQDSEITEVPQSIGNFFNLRYIGLRRTKVKTLPDSVEKLSNLHTLDIKQTKIEKLPRGIAKVKKLRHLIADRYADEKHSEFRYFIGMQAPKDLSNMKELQTLETVQANKDLPDQLKKLLKLRSLWIDNISSADCAELFLTLSNMQLLSSLLLSARDENEALCFEDLRPKSKELHRLIIRGQWAKRTLDYPIFRDHGAQLNYLALSWCHLGEDTLEMLSSRLGNLTYLRLNNMHSAKTLVFDAKAFPRLKTLVLKHTADVNQMKIMNGALPVIEGLYIVSLPGLDTVPPGIETLRTLKKLWLLNLHKNFRTHWIESGMHQKMLHIPELHM